MEETLRHNLLALMGAYERATGTKPATSCRLALNDNKFLSRLGDGAGFNVRTFDRLVEWFDANWPPNAEWPSDVPRPARSERGAAA